MERPLHFPHIGPPFQDDCTGLSRWRKVRTLPSASDGVKVYHAVNQRLQDGLELPEHFDVEKIPKVTLCETHAQEWYEMVQGLLKLDDQRIVKLYGVWQDDEHVYVVKEHCGMEVRVNGSKREVRELFTALTCAKWPWGDKQRREAAMRILQALQRMHDKGLTHPDIRHEYIVLSSTGSIKVDYFTPAKCYSHLRGGSVDPKKHDVLKLGIALFALFFGQHAVPPIQSIPCPAQEASAESLLAHLMHPEPSDRPSIETALAHPWLAPTTSVTAIAAAGAGCATGMTTLTLVANLALGGQ